MKDKGQVLLSAFKTKSFLAHHFPVTFNGKLIKHATQNVGSGCSAAMNCSFAADLALIVGDL